MLEDHGIAADDVREARGGNAIAPGMALFTGASFAIYLLVKLAAGTVAADTAFAGQLLVAAALLIWGGVVMKRGRFYHVTVVTAAGERRIKGLSKAQQVALLDRFAEKTEHETVPDA